MPAALPALHFLAMARRCEAAELEQLALTSELVGVTGRLIHGLQLERGLSSLYLGSNGAHFAARRLEQIEACRPMEAALLQWFGRLDANPSPLGSRARLFNRIAYAQQGLAALEGLRQRISLLEWPAQRAAAAYRRLIAALLTVVFEAADGASDPEVSRLLVAVFHLMQGKEFAGQERAIGAALLATGVVAADEQKRLLRLIESQERCTCVVEAFAASDASPSPAESSLVSAALGCSADLERLRRVLLTCEPGSPLARGREAEWFDHCTRRIDAMRQLEDALITSLKALCEGRTGIARQDLDRFQRLATEATAATEASGKPGPETSSPVPPGPLLFFETPTADNLPSHDPLWADGDERLDPLGPCLGRSVLDLVCEQSRRLQAMKSELASVRATLNERKVIERAKGLLMAHRKLNEDQAHRALRQLAMNQSRRLVEVAEAVLTTSDMLADPTTPPA